MHKALEKGRADQVQGLDRVRDNRVRARGNRVEEGQAVPAEALLEVAPVEVRKVDLPA